MLIDQEELNRAADVVAKARRSASLGSAITPRNMAAIRARFLDERRSGRRYNPVLSYPTAPDGVESALDLAEHALPTAQPWRDLLAQEIMSTRMTWLALHTRDAGRITEDSVRRFGVPDEAGLAQARAVLQRSRGDERPEPSVGHPAHVAARVMLAALAWLGLDDWSVEVREDMAARMSVLGARKVVRIREHAAFTEAELARLVVHEVGTHAARWANSACQRLHLLAVSLGAHSLTDEGLAVVHERRAGVATVEVERRYALRYLACHVALQGDFCSVVDELTPYTSEDEAFDVAMRVKRGMIDTSAPGGYLKDQVYLAGAAKVTDHLSRRPDDLELLMSSRWPITHVGLLRMLREQGYLVPRPARAGVAGVVGEAILTAYR